MPNSKITQLRMRLQTTLTIETEDRTASFGTLETCQDLSILLLLKGKIPTHELLQNLFDHHRNKFHAGQHKITDTRVEISLRGPMVTPAEYLTNLKDGKVVKTEDN